MKGNLASMEIFLTLYTALLLRNFTMQDFAMPPGKLNSWLFIVFIKKIR